MAFLSQPASYPDGIDAVECIETHMSYVFLAGAHAYKLKKAVHYPFLDFSDAAARRRDCLEELRLNRRLAPTIYLGVVPVTQAPDGRLAIAGDGAPVDWLVQMRRLSRARMLDRAITEGTVPGGDVEAAVGLLVKFYGAEPAEPIAAAMYRRGLEHEVRDNRAVLLEPQFGLPRATVQGVIRAQLALLRSARRLFDDRVDAGRIVEGHGDLRPSNVYLGPPPEIIDCLEFNRALRIVDPIDEIGLLALECRFRGAAAVARRVLDAYAAQSGDAPPPALLAFHQSRRACLRARLCLRHIAEPAAAGAAVWRDRAMAYLDLARDAAEAFES